MNILDFGLAKLMGDERAVDETDETVTVAKLMGDERAADETAVTAAGAVSAPGKIAGTPAYMAPEQASGERVDARSDIFSFGAMLYEMLTGDCAFAGASTAETLAAVVRAQPKPLGEIVPNTPGDLQKLISRCLRKDPAAALPAHRRCEGRVARDQGRLGVRFCGRGANLPSASRGHDHSVHRRVGRPRRNDLAAEIPTENRSTAAASRAADELPWFRAGPGTLAGWQSGRIRLVWREKRQLGCLPEVRGVAGDASAHR